MSQSLYEFLGLSKNASPDVIRAAINTVADRHAASGADATQARMLMLCAEILLVPEKRKDYDKRRSEKEAGANQHGLSNETDTVKKSDYSVFLLTLPLAFSSSILFFVAMSSWPVFAKYIISGIYGIMAVVVGIIAACELFKNSEDDDPVPSVVMFCAISAIWPIGYVWYMSGRGRYGLRGLTITPIIIVIASLVSFYYPIMKIEKIEQQQEQKRQHDIDQLKYDQEEFNRRADEHMRKLLNQSPSQQ